MTEQKTKRFEASVVGVTFEGRQDILRGYYEEWQSREDAGETKIVWSGLLVRQPDNPYDPNAIAVVLVDRQIGFIPAALAAKLAARMDAGQEYRVVGARIIKGGSEDKPVYGARIEIEAPAERMVG